MHGPTSCELAFLGLPFSLVDIAAGPFLAAVVHFVAAGAAAIVAGLGRIVLATSEPDLGAPLVELMGRTAALGGALALPLVMLAILQGLLRQELGLVVRAVLVRVPAAAVLSAAGLELVRLGVSVGDAMTRSLLGSLDGSVRSLFGTIGAALALSGAVGLPGFALLVLSVVAAGVSMLVWLELVLRSAAIEVAALFLPIALAGLLWPPTAHWGRRIGETIGALILSKVVIVGVLALSASLLVHGATGATAIVQGIALLALAALAPFALLRLIPAVEAGAVAHLDGLAHQGLRAVRHAGGQLPRTRAEPAPFDPVTLARREDDGPDVGFSGEGMRAPFDPARFEAELSEQVAVLGGRSRPALRPADESGGGAVRDGATPPGHPPPGDTPAASFDGPGRDPGREEEA